MSKTIKELEDGYRGDITVLILQVNKGVTAKGAPYLSFQLQDKTGNIDGKYWNVKEETLYRFTPGMVVRIEGDVLSHNKHLQLRVNNMEILSEDAYDIADYVKEGPISKAELQKQIYGYLEQIENPIIAQICKAIIEECKKDFFEYPAATKNHHAFVGGLATHVLGMMHLADSLCEQYAMLNRDLLIAGVMLHDIGKLEELSGALISEYTTQGRLLGHISIMQSKINEIANSLGFEGEEVTLLRHMILSHHGRYEYGSPILPMIPEAEMLYMIDNIDARMNTMDSALLGIEEGSFTQRIFALESRCLYKAKLNKTEKEE